MNTFIRLKERQNDKNKENTAKSTVRQSALNCSYTALTATCWGPT